MGVVIDWLFKVGRRLVRCKKHPALRKCKVTSSKQVIGWHGLPRDGLPCRRAAGDVHPGHGPVGLRLNPLSVGRWRRAPFMDCPIGLLLSSTASVTPQPPPRFPASNHYEGVRCNTYYLPFLSEQQEQGTSHERCVRRPEGVRVTEAHNGTGGERQPRAPQPLARRPQHHGGWGGGRRGPRGALPPAASSFGPIWKTGS